MTGITKNWAYSSASTRDLRIDFLRGVVMMVLVISHIEIFSWFNYLTWERIGVVSGGEGFVILAGIVLGFVYKRKIHKIGLFESAKLMYDRGFQLYRVNVFIIASIALIALIPFIDATGAITYTNRGSGTTYPLYPTDGTALHVVIAQFLFLKSGPHQVQILGLYFTMFLFVPFAFFLLEKGKWKLLSAISFILFMKNWAFPSMPTGMQFEYGFPILAWQFIFFHGIIFGYYKAEIAQWFVGKRKMIGLAIAYTLFMAFMLFSWNSPNPFMPPSSKLTWIEADTFYNIYNLYFKKNSLGVLRILNYVVVLVVLNHILTLFWKPINKAFGWFFITLGQSSLYVFILHIYVLLLIYNLPIFNGLIATYTSGNIWLNTLGHALALTILWLSAHYKFCAKWIPN